jgi:hypothetical protein
LVYDDKYNHFSNDDPTFEELSAEFEIVAQVKQDVVNSALELLWETGKKININEFFGHPIQASDLCDLIPNVCDRGYSLPGDTKMTLLASFPSGGAMP